MSELPERKDLLGMSRSEFKTKLKLAGHKVPRDFFQKGSVSWANNRAYRWRWWGTPSTGDKTFVVDMSCPIDEFDRWANSVDRTINAEQFFGV